MKVYRLEHLQNLPVSLETAWSFFSDPRKLPEITPPALGFQITSDLPERMYPGMIISYTLKPFPGLKVAWVTEITQVHEPHLFVDDQRFGPYRLWHHQHHFREIAGGVEMRDIVSYGLPFGPLGRLGAPLVRRQLKAIFEFRREALVRRFGPFRSS